MVFGWKDVLKTPARSRNRRTIRRPLGPDMSHTKSASSVSPDSLDDTRRMSSRMSCWSRSKGSWSLKVLGVCLPREKSATQYLIPARLLLRPLLPVCLSGHYPEVLLGVGAALAHGLLVVNLSRVAHLQSHRAPRAIGGGSVLLGLGRAVEVCVFLLVVALLGGH